MVRHSSSKRARMASPASEGAVEAFATLVLLTPLADEQALVFEAAQERIDLLSDRQAVLA